MATQPVRRWGGLRGAGCNRHRRIPRFYLAVTPVSSAAPPRLSAVADRRAETGGDMPTIDTAWIKALRAAAAQDRFLALPWQNRVEVLMALRRYASDALLDPAVVDQAGGHVAALTGSTELGSIAGQALTQFIGKPTTA